MLTGLGVVGGTYYVQNVPTPDQLQRGLPGTTTVYYSDGKTEMAKLSAEAQYPLTFDQMNDAVKNAIVAAEDQSFWTNEGVDFKGVMRAAWNNFTGGETQGGSTITQQYARVAMDLQGATYSRKLREAVMAWKIDDKVSKQTILEYYLNIVPFGRRTHGIEAAAQVFFGKTARKTANPKNQITVAEAIVLMAMVKQPEPDPSDPDNSPGYDPKRSKDPNRNAKALQLSKDRWNYIRQAMVDLKYLSQPEADAMVYPEKTLKAYDSKAGGTYLDRPTGLVVSHAMSELVNSPNSPFKGKTWDYIRDGGFKIITTIDKRAQKAAEEAADITSATAPSRLRGQPKNWQAALVAVEPGTGRILAYFGGKDGAGSDYAGWFVDEQGDAKGYGAHSPGSSWKVYDLVAALQRNYSMWSYWDSGPNQKEFPEEDRVRGKRGPIRNASTARCNPCSLIDSTTQSLNVPFFALTLSLGAANVLKTARDAGIDYMWDNVKNEKRDLRGLKDMTGEVPSHFSSELGIGQFKITVMDHANGVATLAASGNRADAHFVKTVLHDDKPVYGETIRPRSLGLSQQQVADLNYTLSKVETGRFSGSWDSAGKTGTWQKGTSTSLNSDVWTVGYTKALSAAVWVGTKDGAALKTKNGSTRVFGASYAGPIWQQFMRDAHEAMGLKGSDPKYQFGQPAGTGVTEVPGAVGSPAPAPPPIDPCIIPFNPNCPRPGGPGGGGPGGGGPGGGGIVTDPPAREVGLPPRRQ
jgi:membrane peptidoglycan carboxypeptidase